MVKDEKNDFKTIRIFMGESTDPFVFENNIQILDELVSEIETAMSSPERFGALVKYELSKTTIYINATKVTSMAISKGQS